MKTYTIPVTWEMIGEHEVKANSLEEAKEIALEMNLPKTAHYVPDSMQIDPSMEEDEEVHVYDSQTNEIQKWDKVRSGDTPIQDEYTQYSFLGEGTVVGIVGENLVHVIDNNETKYDYTLRANKLTKI